MGFINVSGQVLENKSVSRERNYILVLSSDMINKIPM